MMKDIDSTNQNVNQLLFYLRFYINLFTFGNGLLPFHIMLHLCCLACEKIKIKQKCSGFDYQSLSPHKIKKT